MNAESQAVPIACVAGALSCWQVHSCGTAALGGVILFVQHRRGRLCYMIASITCDVGDSLERSEARKFVPHSLRNASIGLIDAAPRAGSQAARPATASMIAAQENKTNGSAARVP